MIPGFFLVFIEVSVFFRLSPACPGSNGNITYDAVVERIAIDTGNDTRTPYIIITDTTGSNIIRRYKGCYTTHSLTYNKSDWTYQVAHFKFENTISLESDVRLRGTYALSVAGKNIVIGRAGSLKVDSRSSPSPFQDPRFVGGFVPKSGSSAPPYHGPGRGHYHMGEAGGAGHGGHGGGHSAIYGNSYGLNNFKQYLGGSTGAFKGSDLPGIGGPAIELKASDSIKIDGKIYANAHSQSQQTDKMFAGSSGGLIRLEAKRVNISKGASIQVKGIPGLCGSSISSCKAYGGSGGIMQIISDSGHIASDAIMLGAGSRGHPPDPQPGFLYINGVTRGHFHIFPTATFSWGHNNPSLRVSASSTATKIQQSSIVNSSEAASADNATPSSTISLSRSSYHSTTIHIKTTYQHAQEISESVSWTVNAVHSLTNRFSFTYEARSSSVHYPHVSTSTGHAVVTSTLSIRTPQPTKTDRLHNLLQLHDQVKSFKERNVSNQAEIVTEFIASFEELTEAGNLTLGIVNVSILLIEELNELMMSELELSVNPSKIQNQLSTLVTTVDDLLDERDAEAWRESGMIMNLVEAVERTSSLALNSTSSTNQSLSFNKKNIELLTFVEYPDSSQNVTIPEPKRQVRSTGSITFQLSEFSATTDNNTRKGQFVVGMVVFKNLTSHFTSNQQRTNNREDSPRAFLNSEIISVAAYYEGKPVHSLDKEALITFGKKTKRGVRPRCVYWKSYPGEREWVSDGLILITSDNKEIVCSSTHLTSFSVLMSLNDVEVSPEDKLALEIITYVGSGISLAALVCAIIIFLCVRSLTDIRYRIHLNLCISLATAQVVFLAGITATEKKWLCTLVAVLLHYLYTASFTWMSAEGLHLYFKIVTVFNLQRIKMMYYVIFCWGFPVIVVGISAITRIEGYGAKHVCWLSLNNGFIWSFIGPVIAIILFNLLMLGMIIKVLASLKNVAETNAQQNNVRSGIKATLMLMPLLGITWAFGLLSVNSETVAFQYLFAIVNSLQGLFIFACHCIGNTEVRAALDRLKKRHSLKVASSQEVSLDKLKSKAKGSKGSKVDATEDPNRNSVTPVDPTDLELKDIN